MNAELIVSKKSSALNSVSRTADLSVEKNDSLTWHQQQNCNKEKYFPHCDEIFSQSLENNLSGSFSEEMRPASRVDPNWAVAVSTGTFVQSMTRLDPTYYPCLPCLSPVSGRGGGGWGVLLGIFGRVVPPGSPNPDPISDQNMPFSTPVFRPFL